MQKESASFYHDGETVSFLRLFPARVLFGTPSLFSSSRQVAPPATQGQHEQLTDDNSNNHSTINDNTNDDITTTNNDNNTIINDNNTIFNDNDNTVINDNIINHNMHLEKIVVVIAVALGFSMILGRLDIVNDRLDVVEETLSLVQTTVQSLSKDTQSRELSIEAARNCSVSVTVFPPSEDGNTMACGTLVGINGLPYVVTNAHVVYDTNRKCEREIVQIQTLDGRTVPLQPDLILKHRRKDLALIPVHEGAKEWLTFCSISRDSVRLGDHLVGIAHREKGQHFVSGDVRQKDTKRSGCVSGNFPGTNGFSGTGYFHKSVLYLVHVGADSFTHFGTSGWDEPVAEFDDDEGVFESESHNDFEFSKSKTVYDTLHSSIMDLNRNSTVNATAFIDSLRGYLYLHYRNPLSRGVEARYVLELDKYETLSGTELCEAHAAAAYEEEEKKEEDEVVKEEEKEKEEDEVKEKEEDEVKKKEEDNEVSSARQCNPRS